MPKYMTRVSFTTEGVKGLQKEKPTQRRAAVAKLLESAGGKLETFYFAFGQVASSAEIQACWQQVPVRLRAVT